MIPLAHLDSAALACLAEVHCEVMHTLLAELGAPLVRRYYQVAQADPSVLGLCAISPYGAVLGWAMGSPAPAVLNARLRQPLVLFVAQIMRQSIKHPVILLDLIRSALSSSPVNTIQTGQVELTYIGVAPAAQGHGIGKALLTAFMDSARLAGFRSVVLSVETDNPGALALYTSGGFHITQSFQEGRFIRHRMECEIPSIKLPQPL